MERPDKPAKPVIFISYSHKDEPEKPGDGEVQWLTYVQSFLAPAAKHGVIDTWVDRDIKGGGDWEGEIEAKLAACDVFILLASRYSLASDYVIDKEIAAITERQEKGEPVHFYPIVLTSPTQAGRAKIESVNLRPRDGNPLYSYTGHDRDAHMEAIANEIAALAEGMAAERASVATPPGTQKILHREIHPTENFIGRDAQMAAIGDALAKGAEAAITQPAAVHGLGGIGKSTLARQFAWDRRADYAGIWWLDAEKSKDSETWDGIERGLIALRAELSPGTEEPQDRAQAARDTMAALSRLSGDQPWLLIYDNVDDFQVTDHGNWPAPENVQILITSRIRNWRGNVAEVEVTEWDMPDAIRYLQSESSRDDLTEPDAQNIAETLGRHPLALSHAAAYLLRHGTVTAEAYVANLTRRMNEAPKGAEYPRSVFATFQAALDDAEAEAPGARSALSLAAFFAPDDIPEELFQQDAEYYPDDLGPIVADDEALAHALSALERLSLIEFAPHVRTFSVHRLVQQAARDALGDAVSAWAGNAVESANATFPFVEFANWSWCERLLAHARAAAGHAEDAIGEPLSRLLNQAGFYLHERAAYIEAEPLYKRSLEIRETALDPDHLDIGTSLNNLCLLYYDQGKYDEAEPLYRRSLEIRETALGPDHPSVGTLLNNLALLYEAQDKYDEAEPLYRRDLEISETALGPDHPNTAITVGNIARLLAKTGRLQEALPMARRAHAIFVAALDESHPHTRNAAELLEAIERAVQNE